MRLVKWDPFHEFQSMTGADSSGRWAPLVEVFERGDDMVIRAEIPGVDRDSVEVRVENDTLTLEGERKRDADLTEGRSYRSERIYGAFTRRFKLPTTVDSSKISATHKDGVLELVLPQAESSKPRRVEIEAA
jgi:HSP20 family protein